MGVYNPSAPQILGQEWVPIRNEDVEFAPTVNSVERGYSYSLTANRRIHDARLYLARYPDPQVSQQTWMVNTYPIGREALSGPIREAIIPVSFASITGTNGTNWSIVSIFAGATLADTWFRPDDFSYVNFFQVNSCFSRFSVWFDVDKFPFLQGKRILNVSMDYAGTAYDTGNIPSTGAGTVVPPPQYLINPDPNTPATSLNLNRFSSGLTYSKGAFSNLGAMNELDPPLPAPFGANNSGATIHSINLGDSNPIFSASSTGALETMPWTYNDLLFFNQGSGPNRFEPQILMQIPITAYGDGHGGAINLYYLALRVTYCEENRVMAGGRIFVYPSLTNPIIQRGLDLTTDPVLPAGDYTTTLAMIDPGDRGLFLSTVGQNPSINAVREIYALPTQPGVEVDIPFPLSSGLGSQFSKQSTHIIPQISLHTSGGVLTEIHPYGRQSQGQVFGVQTVTQEVLDSAAGGAAQYPQVRFYARRFGNTTVPLTLSSPTITGTGTSVSITPAEFDALDEILDGWKQIDLRFAGTVTMGSGTSPQWKWTAAGELPGNRWEILGASAPAISGALNVPFNLATQQLSAATYGQPSSGSTINEGWLPQNGPYVSGAVDDQTSDATLLFSQDQPTISGFVVSGASQTLTGIGLNCNTYPWYVPSAISYNQLGWTLPTGLILDTFSTPAVSGWSPADTGQAFTNAGGAPVASYSVSGGTGKMAISVLNTGYAQSANLGTPTQDLTIFITPPALVTGVGAVTIVDLRIRRTDDSNNYSGRLAFNTGGVINATLFKTVAGVGATLGTAPDLTHVDGHTYGLRVSAIGSLIQLKAWDATINPEPTWWQVSATNSELTTGNLFSVFAFASSAVTNTLPYTFQFDNLTSDVRTFGYYEIQRLDTLTDWQTIAQISPFVSGFRDYEARVGLLSSYRIRGVNSYLFPGQWSSTATLTMAAPGLTGTGMTGDPYVLIFTSNFRQDGSRSLAYSLAYDGTPTEPFAFPEAGFTQYQFMYNRDFQVAFRPLERGGETFSRTVLVQAAAISPETLADFKSLRDMAWDTLPYVCVRDQDGNRWFANVTVPTGRVQHQRQLYLADINVIEVTETSSVTVF